MSDPWSQTGIFAADTVLEAFVISIGKCGPGEQPWPIA